MPPPRIEPVDTCFLERVRPAGWRNPVPQAIYDLAIVGAGPAGLAAARAARGLELRVALVERHWLGGNSLNVGSIPSKSLVRSGRAFEALVNAGQFGASTGREATDDGAAMRRMRAIRMRIAEYCAIDRLTAEGIDVFFGDASFVDQKSLRVGTAALSFRKALVASGARPQASPIPGLNDVGILTSATLFDLKILPKRLGVIGGGPLGCEMAQAFAHMGTRVTILQDKPKFLPGEERDAAEILARSLARSGVDTRLNTPVVGVRAEGGDKWIDAVCDGVQYSIAVDEILLSVGRTANSGQLRLADAGIKCAPDGTVEVDDYLRTSNDDVYAAGDVCMAYMFANVAEATGRMAVFNAFAEGQHRKSQMIVPWCTFCDPEIAHIGMQIWDAKQQSIPVKTFTIMMQDVDRAITDGRDDGFVKIHVRDGTDEIIGATIVASRASEMINEVAVIMNGKIGMRRLAEVLHTYPAQSDAIRMAAIAYRKSLKNPR
jgi:pyruvate/2-oxoglutarate dehydrogenase complex dihydrolipoamide dehydrogenase (E3) component